MKDTIAEVTPADFFPEANEEREYSRSIYGDDYANGKTIEYINLILLADLGVVANAIMGGGDTKVENCEAAMEALITVAADCKSLFELLGKTRDEFLVKGE